MNLSEIDFYFITDSGLSKEGICSDVEKAVSAGCKIVQYREKNKSTKEMITQAKKLKKICANKAVFLINDRVDVALAVDADGVHLGWEDMAFDDARKILGDKIIGLTVHNVDEAKEAQLLGADYMGLSPIYPTSTKKDAGESCGLDMIIKVKKEVDIPIVAIGGIEKENVVEVINAGADSAAAISAVINDDGIKKNVSEFIKIIKENAPFKKSRSLRSN